MYTESYIQLFYGTSDKASEKVLSEGFKLNTFDIQDINNESEIGKIIILRAILISFFADKFNKVLVIGNFMQPPQPLYDHAIAFSNSLHMVFGIETIYCVKDLSIISNLNIL